MPREVPPLVQAIDLLTNYLNHVHPCEYLVKWYRSVNQIIIVDKRGAKVFTLDPGDWWTKYSCKFNKDRIVMVCSLITERHDSKWKTKTKIPWKTQTNNNDEHLYLYDFDLPKEAEMDDKTREEVRKDYLAGMGLKDMKEKYNVSMGSLYCAIEGLPKRGNKPLAKKIEDGAKKLADSQFVKRKEKAKELFETGFNNVTLPDGTLDTNTRFVVKPTDWRGIEVNTNENGDLTATRVPPPDQSVIQEIAKEVVQQITHPPDCLGITPKFIEDNKYPFIKTVGFPVGWTIKHGERGYIPICGLLIFKPVETLTGAIAVTNQVEALLDRGNPYSTTPIQK